MAKRFPEETIREVLRRFGKGERGSDLAKEYGFHPTQISKWRQRFQARKKITKQNKPTKSGNKNQKSEAEKKVLDLEKTVQFWQHKYLELVKETSE